MKIIITGTTGMIGEGVQHVLSYYKYFAWLIPIVKMIAPNIYSTMKQVAHAMTYVSKYGYKSNVIYVKNINKISSLS